MRRGGDRAAIRRAPVVLAALLVIGPLAMVVLPAPPAGATIEPAATCANPAPKYYTAWNFDIEVVNDDTVERELNIVSSGEIPATDLPRQPGSIARGVQVTAVWQETTDQPPVDFVISSPLADDRRVFGPLVNFRIDPNLQGMAVTRLPAHASAFSWERDGSFTWEPAPSWTGGDSFSYRIQDLGSGHCHGREATVTIPPSVLLNTDITVDDTYTVYSDSTFEAAGGGGGLVCDVHEGPRGAWPACGVLANDAATFVGTWCAGTELTCRQFTDEATFATRHGVVTLRSNGSFTYTPEPGYTGSDGFEYATAQPTVSMSSVNAGGSIGFRSLVTFNVVQRPPGVVNNAPLNLTVDQRSVFLEPPYTPSGFTPLPISPTPGSPDTSAIVAINGSQAESIRTQHGTLAVTWNRGRFGGVFPNFTIQPCLPGFDPFCVKTTAASISYTPDVEYHGPDRFGYRTQNQFLGSLASVSVGTCSEGICGITSPAIVASGVDNQAFITVNNVLTPPRSVSGCMTVELPNHSSRIVDIRDPYTDPDGLASPLHPTLSSEGPGPLNPPTGTLTRIGDYEWRFDGTSAGDPESYWFYDFAIPWGSHLGSGIVHSCFFFVVTPYAAVDDSYSVDQNQVLDVPASGVLGNDDPPPVGAGAVTVQTEPENGMLTLDPDGAFRYTPETNFHGSDTFTYLNNGYAATVDVTVNHVEQPPEVTLNSPGCNPLLICPFSDPDNRLNLSAGWPGRLRGFLTDPEADPGTMTVDWGDGTTTTTTYPCLPGPGCPFQTTPTYGFACEITPCEGNPLYFELTHVYAEPPTDPTTFTITATATSGDTLSDTATSTATVFRPLANAITGFTLPATGVIGESLPLSAIGGGSSEPVVFAVDETSGAGVCSVAGAELSLTGPGRCVVNADQAADGTYAAAARVQRSITVLHGFHGFTGVVAKGTAARSTGNIRVKFRLADAAGNTLPSGVAATLAAARKVRATLSGPGISPVTERCGWDATARVFYCDIAKPKAIRRGTANSYTVTVRENVGTGFVLAPPVGGATNPAQITFV